MKFTPKHVVLCFTNEDKLPFPPRSERRERESSSQNDDVTGEGNFRRVDDQDTLVLACSFRVVDALWSWHREDTSSSNDSVGKKARHNSEAEDLQPDQQRGLHQQISSCGARFYSRSHPQGPAPHKANRDDVCDNFESGALQEKTSNSGGVRINSCYEAPKISKGLFQKFSFFCGLSL
ncbi:hypothetical protein CDAR_384901 [Caerostris darwini]|uniref:Uncharacterized protein n=1 Tax=Caerostris darwini TaxID=1538125 RepID=A0AAV4WCZ3_9ARAC|nr:hypothetical protein CDAR_384901 [Caerostris darwini]